MVAISILALSLAGPFVAVRSALGGSYVARDQLIASALAQEGLEYIRSIRDNNYLEGGASTWMSGLSSKLCYGNAPTRYCTVDPNLGDTPAAIVEYTSITPGNCNAGARCLYISANDLYNQQNDGTVSSRQFKRVVQLFRLSDTEVRVVVEVHWSTSGKAYTVTVTDTLRDWL